MKAAETLGPKGQQFSKIIILSANTLTDHVNGLAGDTQYQLNFF
jgi:hypothetical protein